MYLKIEIILVESRFTYKNLKKNNLNLNSGNQTYIVKKIIILFLISETYFFFHVTQIIHKLENKNFFTQLKPFSDENGLFFFYIHCQ